MMFPDGLYQSSMKWSSRVNSWKNNWIFCLMPLQFENKMKMKDLELKILFIA